MRRILAAILSAAIALEPLAAANATPYLRFQPSDAAAASTSTTANDTTSAAGITGPVPLYAHAYSFVDDAYALASGKAATFSATGLPTGLSMAADGTLSGTPTAEASGVATVTALSADGTTQTLAVPYEVHGLFQANYTPDADGFVEQSGHINVALAIPAPVLTGGPVLPVTWSLTQGTFLPAGVNLNGDGSVSGTPTVFGHFDFSVLATDASGATAVTQSLGLTIADGIHVAALPDVSGHVGFPLIPVTGSATGTIVGPVAWSLVPAALPAGVTLNGSTGTVSGTPTAASPTTSHRLSAVDSTGIAAYSDPFGVTAYGALAVDTVADMSLHVGQSFTSAPFTPLNGPVSPWTWRLTPGASLPSSLGVDANAGDVYGTGGAVGSATATVDLVDFQGDKATSNPFNVSVVAPLALAAIADRSVPSGGTVTVTPSLSGTPVGTLHWDLTGYGYGVSTTQDPATGAVTFSSAMGSKGNYRLVAYDDSGVHGDAAHASVSQSFTVSFEAPFTAAAPTADTYAGTYRRAGVDAQGKATTPGDTVTLPAATVAANPNAPGGGAAPASVTWTTADGTLPSGLSVNAKTGVVSGTLKADAASATVTLVATDANGVQVGASPRLAFTVLAPLDFAPPPVSAHVGQPLDATATTPTVTGGAPIGTLTWSLLSGTLPAGMSVDPATGAIVGTPTGTAGQSGDADPDGLVRAFGRFAALLSPVTPAHAQAAGAQTTTVTIQAKDSKGQAGTAAVTRKVTVVVAPALSVATQADVNVRVGDALATPVPSTANAVGTQAWTLAKSSDALPSWLALDAGKGTLSVSQYPYTAISPYSGSIALHVVDGAGGAGVDAPAFKVTVKPALRIVGLGSSVAASFGQAFSSVTPSVQNGPVGSLAWKLSSTAPNGTDVTSTIPAWIKVDPATGVVSGTYPGTAADATNGTYVVSQLYLTAVDGAGEPATMAAPFSVVVGTNLVLGASPSVYVRQGNSLDVAGPAVTAGTATPTGPYSFSMASGNLPKGVQVAKGTGEIAGRPSATDNSASGSLQVVDSAGHFGLGNVFPITVLAPLAVDVQPPALTTFVGGPIATAAPVVSSNNPVAPVTWTQGSGTLPPGSKLAPDGSLSGTATQASPAGAPFVLTLSGVDASTNKDPVTGGATVSVTVQPAMMLPAQPALSFRTNTAQSTAVTAVLNSLGGVGYALRGTLPANLTMDGSGNVYGTPTTTGSATVTLTATDAASTVAPTAANQTASQPLTVSVLGPLTLTPPTMSTVVAHVGSTVSIALPAVGNSPVTPGTWTLSSGSLPAPLALTSNAISSASAVLPAEAAGDYPLTLTYTDGVGATASTGFTLSVRGPLSVDDPAASTTVAMNVATAIPAPAVHGNPGSPSWSLLTGSLPRGLSVRPTDGAIVGQATRSGTFNAVIGFTDASGASASTKPFAIAVPALQATQAAEVDLPLNSGTPAPAPALSGNPLPTVAWTVASGTLPPGFKLGADGSVAGTATQPGSYPVTLLATDANGETASVSFLLKIPTLALAAAADPTNVVLNTATTIPAPVAAPGSAAPTVTWKLSGPLPKGTMAFSTATGAVAGKATNPGTFPLTVSATDGNGVALTPVTFKLVVAAPVVAIVADLPLQMNTSPATVAPTVTGDPGQTLAWTLALGPLPPGVGLNADGTLSGAATTPGTYPVQLSYLDSNGVTGSTNVFNVVVPSLALASSVAEQDIALNTSATIPAPSVSGTPTTAQTWTLASGALPPGLALARGTGVISGAATRSGSFPVSLKLVDGNGQTVTTNVFKVVVAPLAMASAPTVQVARAGLSTPPSALLLHQGDAGYAFAAPAITGIPSGTVTWSATGAGLPPGVAYNASTGRFGGAPTASGTYTLALVATDANGEMATGPSFTMSVLPPLFFGAVTNVTLSTAYNRSVSAPSVAGSPQTPYLWQLASGTLPAKTALAPASGAISGQPDSTGSYPITLSLTDSTGAAVTTPSFTLNVNGVLTATAPATASVHANGPSVLVAGTAAIPRFGVPPYSYKLASADGTQPPGLSVDPATGLLSGSVSEPQGTTYPVKYNISETVTDSGTDINGAPHKATATTATYEVDVTAPLSVATPAGASIHAGATANAAPAVTNGTGSLAWAIASPASPPVGMSVSGGVVSTTAVTPPGTYAVALTVTDSTGAYATTGNFNVTVYGAMAMTGPSSILMRNGTPYTAAKAFAFAATNGIAAADNTGASTFAAGSTAPTGMSFSATGAWSGTPSGTTAVGTAAAPGSLVVTVSDKSSTNAAGGTGYASLTVPFAYYPSPLGITASDGGTYATGVPVSLPAPVVTGTPVNPKFALSATLPAGLSLNADGSVTGTATQAVSITETMTVTDDTGSSASTAPFTIATLVATTADLAYPSSITNSSAVATSVASMYDQSTATATSMPAGGTLTYAFPVPVTANGIVTGAGATVASNLVAYYNSGTPSAPVWTKVAGAANPTSTLFRVAYNGTASATLPDLRLTYGGNAPAYAPSITAGTAYAGTGQATPIPLDGPMATLNPFGTETWTTTSTTAGFTLAQSGPTLTVAKTVSAGTYPITLSVTDAHGVASDPAILSVVVTTPPALTSATPPAIAQGAAYSTVLNTVLSGTNVTSGASWSVSGVPAGFAVSGTGTSATLSAASGNAAATGSYPVSVTVTNTGGNGLKASATLNLTVDAAPALTAALDMAVYGQAYSANLSGLLAAANVSPGATWTVSGTQPSGFALGGTDTGATYSAASGNAGALGTYPLTFKVTNPDGLTASAVLTLTDTGTPVMASAKTDSTNYGLAYSKVLSSLMAATTVHPSATWAIAPQGGTLPTGYAVSGVGTAATLTNGSTLTAAAGTYAIVVTLTNPGGYAATNTLNLTINSDPCYAATVPAVGTACFDGSIYAGASPNGNKRMVVNPNYLIGVSSEYNTQYGNTDANNGQADTATIVARYASSSLARSCTQSSFAAKSDWYVPAVNELKAMGNYFSQAGSPPTITSSTELNSVQMASYVVNTGKSNTVFKNSNAYSYCVRIIN